MPVTAWPLSLQKRGGQTKRLVNVKPHRVKVEIFRLEVAGFQLGEAVPYEYHYPACFLTSCPKNTAYGFIGNVVLSCNLSERFALVNAMKNTRPLSNGYFPMRF
jgi:hypothetical protein